LTPLALAALLPARICRGAGLGTIDHFRQTADIGCMVLFGVATLLVAQVAVAVVTWGVMVDVTRTTLKAIELLSRK
jgi:hypothetical protein